MKYQIHELNDADCRGLWSQLVEESPFGWFWSTWAMHQFRVEYARSTGRFFEDRSFIVTEGGQPVGLAPVVFVKSLEGYIFASHIDCPLPWPMAIGRDENELIEREAALLDEVERRARSSGAGVIRLMLDLPRPDNERTANFFRVIRERVFVDVGYDSHLVVLNSNVLSTVRERDRRKVKKYRGQYELKILEGSNLPADIARTYMDLHMRDAGRSTRPLLTYEKQVGLVQAGEGFWVVASHKETDRVVGMLLVSLHKNAAYDNSVAVDPDFSREPVSHLMKWVAIEKLLEVGATHYELGFASVSPTYTFQPSQKNFGISFFKDGWARGGVKRVYAADKFLTQASFDCFWESARLSLLNYFDLSGRPNDGSDQ